MTGTKFVVDFGDVQLPKDMANRMDQAIRQAVVGAVAGLDFQGDEACQLKRPPKGLNGLICVLDHKMLDRPLLNPLVNPIHDIARPGGG